MDIEKYLIILKGEDKTIDVLCYENSSNDKIKVVFKNNNKEYEYLKNNCKVFTNPTELDIEKYGNRLTFGDVFNVKKLLKFDMYLKVIFNDDSTKLFLYNDLSLNNNDKQSSEKIFRYLKEVANIVSIKTDDGTALLADEFSKIKFVEKNTALYVYLNSINIGVENKNNDLYIFPFGSNKSQKEAVEKVFNNRISVIEGPPGTGKTQTILNIIANIICRNKTVAVVSNNNEATKNVYEKLCNEAYGFLCAPLGKKDNKEEFIRNQNGSYPKIEIGSTNANTIKDSLIRINKNIVESFELQNKKAFLRNLLEEIHTEQEYFNRNKRFESKLEIKSLKRLSTKKLMKMRMEIENAEYNNKKITLSFIMKAVILCGLGNYKYYKLPIELIKENYDQIYYIVKDYESKKQISKINTRLDELKFNEITNLQKDYSNEYLKTIIANKYPANKDRKVFKMSELFKDSKEFLKEYPIILSTTHSIKSCLNSDYKYDYVIIDESSQVDLVTGALALSSAKNAVIVGDQKQLSNVITEYDKKQITDVISKYSIPDNYNFIKQSFLTSVINSIPEISKTLLREHYRCDPKIIGFSNKKFYNNELIILTEDAEDKNTMKAIISAPGNHAREHFNYRQIEIIRDEVLPELQQKVKSEQIGIVSPYNDQKNGIIELKIDNDIKVDTVHKFQGREKDAMIITTVGNNISKFIDDPRLLNVAVTRAKKYLRLIVSKSISESNSNLGDLVKYIQYNNFELVNSKIASIYDLLYKECREQRLQYLKNKNRISEYDSENITYNFIKDILEKNEYYSLDVVSHIPLRRLLNNMEELNDEERKYASNKLTHIDFVIYNKMNKEMVLAIEVDGYAFHKDGLEQNGRDKLKNKILEKYNIPFIRFSTIGSNEEIILEQKLKDLTMFKSEL